MAHESNLDLPDLSPEETQLARDKKLAAEAGRWRKKYRELEAKLSELSVARVAAAPGEPSKEGEGSAPDSLPSPSVSTDPSTAPATLSEPEPSPEQLAERRILRRNAIVGKVTELSVDVTAVLDLLEKRGAVIDSDGETVTVNGKPLDRDTLAEFAPKALIRSAGSAGSGGRGPNAIPRPEPAGQLKGTWEGSTFLPDMADFHKNRAAIERERQKRKQ